MRTPWIVPLVGGAVLASVLPSCRSPAARPREVPLSPAARAALARDSTARVAARHRVAVAVDSLRRAQAAHPHLSGPLRITGPVLVVFHPGPVPQVPVPGGYPNPEVAALVREVEAALPALQRLGDSLGVRVVETTPRGVSYMQDREREIVTPTLSPDAVGYLTVAPGLGPALHLGWPTTRALHEALRRLADQARQPRTPRTELL